MIADRPNGHSWGDDGLEPSLISVLFVDYLLIIHPVEWQRNGHSPEDPIRPGVQDYGACRHAFFRRIVCPLCGGKHLSKMACRKERTDAGVGMGTPGRIQRGVLACPHPTSHPERTGSPCVHGIDSVSKGKIFVSIGFVKFYSHKTTN